MNKDKPYISLGELINDIFKEEDPSIITRILNFILESAIVEANPEKLQDTGFSKYFSKLSLKYNN